MPTRGLNFDTLPTCDSHRYCVVTHLSTFRYSNTENVKTKPQTDQNTPHMKNIHKHMKNIHKHGLKKAKINFNEKSKDQFGIWNFFLFTYV